MGIKEKMMEGMMEKMSGDERVEMMNKMMENFMSKISPEEKRENDEFNDGKVFFRNVRRRHDVQDDGRDDGE